MWWTSIENTRQCWNGDSGHWVWVRGVIEVVGLTDHRDMAIEVRSVAWRIAEPIIMQIEMVEPPFFSYGGSMCSAMEASRTYP
jgi:hypothetical protein